MSNLVMPQKALFTPMGVKPVAEKKEFKFDDEREWVDKTMSKAGDMADIDLFYGQVLVAKHIRTTVGTIGLIASHQTQLEDRYQGKVGLVLKIGPLAFLSDNNRNFGGANPKVGQWVMYRASDGHDANIIAVDGLDYVECRILEDAEIKGVLRYPGRIW